MKKKIGKGRKESHGDKKRVEEKIESRIEDRAPNNGKNDQNREVKRRKGKEPKGGM